MEESFRTTKDVRTGISHLGDHAVRWWEQFEDIPPGPHTPFLSPTMGCYSCARADLWRWAGSDPIPRGYVRAENFLLLLREEVRDLMCKKVSTPSC